MAQEPETDKQKRRSGEDEKRYVGRSDSRHGWWTDRWMSCAL